MRQFKAHFSVVFALLVPLVSLSGCATTTSPVTGQKIIAYLSWDQEIEIGASAAPDLVEQSGGLVSDDAVAAYLTDMGDAMVEQIEPGIPELPWEFGMLDADIVNAFSLPGGKVYISRGLASLLRTEAELAGVVGHEIGHVTARHANQRISRQLNLAAPLILADAAIGILIPRKNDGGAGMIAGVAAPILQVGGKAVSLRYDRAEEYEADEIGMRYMARAGYNPEGQRRVLSVLQQASGGGSFDLFSTHPAPKARVDRATKLLATQFADFTPPRGDGWFAERYESELLSRIGRAELATGLDLDRPASWCAHCAEAVAFQTDGNTRAQLP